MAETSVPQADVLEKLRRLLEEFVQRRDAASAGKAVGLSGRHIDYYFAAAKTLQLVEGAGSKRVLSGRGRALLASAPRSAQEAAILREAVERSAVVTQIAPKLLDQPSPTKDALIKRIISDFHLSPSTAKRRAETLLKWRDDILGQEEQAELPLTAREIMRYSGPAVLRSLRIESFKAFGEPKGSLRGRRTPIAMTPLTVLVGPNGAGKSTILQAVDLMGALVRGNITQMLASHDWEYDDLPHLRSPKQTITIEVEVELGSSVLRWKLVLGTRKHPGVAEELVQSRKRDDANWHTLLDRKGRQVTYADESTGSMRSPPPITLPQSWLGTLDEKDDAVAHPGLLALKGWAERIHAFWSLSPASLRAPSRGITAHVGSHGSDLASFLFRLKKNRSRQFAKFVERVTRHYPRLVQVEPRSGQYGWKYLAVTERWNGEKATFNARQVSDGLLRLMAVASIPDWEPLPSVVLLDEIENGLHPSLIGGIAELLAEISKTTQVLTTTHSPITLNYVAPELTQVVMRGPRGTVVVTPLMETRNYSKLREHFEPGELWYNAGEQRLVARSKS